MSNDYDRPEGIRLEMPSDSGTAPSLDVPAPTTATDTPSHAFKPGFRVYAIVVGLGITNLLAALENTVVSVAAPVLLTDLDLGANFIWITNAFFLSSTAVLPLIGQFCNIFGRRYVMLSVIAIFVLGSGICGGATTGGMLIAGRTVQGVGSGGIIMVSSIVVSDLVPLRERGNMSAILISIFGIGSALGPFIGGAIVSSTTWRWIFYLNLPIGGVAFAVLFIFLRVGYSKEMSFWQKLKRVDLVGNFILVASTVSVLYALSYAGTLYPWKSWHTLVPLLLGFLGLFLFKEETTIAESVVFQSIFAIGLGLVFSTLLPAFQAFIHERDLASCTAAWYFVRLFGHVWGVAIPAAIFNNRVDSLLARGAISDVELAQNLSAGAAYQAASASFVRQLPPASQTEVRAVYREATQRVFQIAIVFAGVAFLLSLFEKEIELRKTLDTEFGLEKKEGEEVPMVTPKPKTQV
ncbi:hypothetical protein O1611_g195 [Lasiodiplodia mahajangana]|uniref:Uncharacterized protein n=1 Tax=Lasiodiplodia mahajangana TaxID=1108764 RepID=A0ACC2K0U7_9PEZI|nr:hypothetical protein O1611_g195 [Lasiodiplodia mahajangana]